MKYVITLIASASIIFSGCSGKDSEDGNATYSPIITVSATQYVKNGNVTMPTTSKVAVFSAPLGQYAFERIQTFPSMLGEHLEYVDSTGLDFVLGSSPTCDSNHTNTMAINVLIPKLTAPDNNNSTFPYINMNIFTSLLAFNSKEALAAKYPNSYLVNSDFNYDALNAALTRYSSNIDIIGGEEARESRLVEFCQAAEELILDDRVEKHYNIRATSRQYIKDSTVTMESKSAEYIAFGKWTFSDVKELAEVHVDGGQYITSDTNESDYNSSLILQCPDINMTSEPIHLAAPLVDANEMPYIFANPFTTLLSEGATIEELNASYPIAYATDNSFNFDTVYKNRLYTDSNESNFTQELCDAIKALQK